MLQNYRLSEIISTTYLIKIVKWWIIDDYFAYFTSNFVIFQTLEESSRRRFH